VIPKATADGRSSDSRTRQSPRQRRRRGHLSSPPSPPSRRRPIDTGMSSQGHRRAQGYTLTDHTLVPDFGAVVNDDSPLVSDHHPPTDRDRVVQLDAVVVSYIAIQPVVQETERHADKAGLETRSPHAEAMDSQSAEPRTCPITAVVAPILAISSCGCRAWSRATPL